MRQNADICLDLSSLGRYDAPATATLYGLCHNIYVYIDFEGDLFILLMPLPYAYSCQTVEISEDPHILGAAY
jgi:hypothetical protein